MSCKVLNNSLVIVRLFGQPSLGQIMAEVHFYETLALFLTPKCGAHTLENCLADALVQHPTTFFIAALLVVPLWSFD